MLYYKIFVVVKHLIMQKLGAQLLRTGAYNFKDAANAASGGHAEQLVNIGSAGGLLNFPTAGKIAAENALEAQKRKAMAANGVHNNYDSALSADENIINNGYRIIWDSGNYIFSKKY